MKKELIVTIWISFLILGCTRDLEKCGCDGAKRNYVTNIFGLVVHTDEGFKIITDEYGILTPCTDLSDDFNIDFQPVTISGQLRLNCNEINGSFKITPVEIDEISIRPNSYDKTDITLTVIRSEDYGYAPGFGYYIEDKRTTFGTKILQPLIPAVTGLNTFDSEDKAIKTGLLSVFSIRKQSAYITPEILDYINVVE